MEGAIYTPKEDQDDTLEPKLACNDLVHIFFTGKLNCECGEYHPWKPQKDSDNAN